MGFNDRMSDEECQYKQIDKFVCVDCFNNIGIKNIINEHGENKICDYCENNTEKTLELNTIIEHILICIQGYYANPVEVAYREEGEFVTNKNYDTREMLNDIGLECKSNYLFEDICHSINNTHWCEADPFMAEEHEIITCSWNEFSDYIKNESRFLFFKPRENEINYFNSQYFEPSHMLDYIGDALNKLNLFRTLNTTDSIYRCRYLDLNEKIDAKSLGTPLPIHTMNMPNRMNPYGIPMFYGALDNFTAINEIYDETDANNIKKEYVTGIFRPVRELFLIDLTKIIDDIDFFDLETNDLITQKLFLRDFIKKINMPVIRTQTTSAYIEYIPTQVVTEYFKIAFNPLNKKNIDGFLFKSSKNQEPCIVLFINQNECADDEMSDNKTILSLIRTMKNSNDDVKKLISDNDW